MKFLIFYIHYSYFNCFVKLTCLVTASTTCQTDVGILPNDVITSGFIPSDMIACKAGQRSRRRTHRANADSEPDSDSSAQASSLSIAVYNVTNRAENENTLYHYISSLIFLLNHV